MDAQGWLTCQPKPENEVLVTQILQKDNNEFDDRFHNGKFCLVAQWGTKQVYGSFLQWGESGEWVCRNINDPTDVWIVQQVRFNATYNLKG